MTRIKSDNVQLTGSFVVPIEQETTTRRVQEAMAKEKEIILQAETQARNLIEQAQSQAAQIIEDARTKAQEQVDEITQKAYDEGFSAGHSEGLQRIREELNEQIISVDNFAKSNFEMKKSIVKSAHQDIIKLVIEISKKICAKSLELDDSILFEITQNAITALKDKESITIIVNPQMAEKIYSISEELKEKIPQLSSIKIIEDNSVSPDGTIVESPLSRVDSRIKSQIDEIADRLMEKIDSTPTEEFISEVESTDEHQS